MTTPSGQIGLSDVNAELGYSPTALISMNDSAVRTLAGVGGSGTVISMNNLRGKSNRVAVNLTISASTYNYNAYTAVSSNPGYNAGKTDATITINPGVTIGSTSTGTSSFSVPSSFNPGDTVTIVNNGIIRGCGGSGGTGGNGNPNPAGVTAGSAGQSGGIAVLVQRTTTFTNNGSLVGGGGGGGGGGGIASRVNYPEDVNFEFAAGGGGGGGSGYNSGSGASAGSTPWAPTAGFSGSSGTQTSGGGGGNGGKWPGYQANGGAGGAGGGQGSSGSNGGQGFFSPQGGNPSPPANIAPGGAGGGAGAYISGAPYVTWPATGTRLGPSS